jgi:AmmeMemoRadiSam system protein A
VDEDSVCDHSVEIQLPLLQKAVPGSQIVPLYVGAMDGAQRSAVARVLAQHVQPGDVLLASSDLTHYGRAFDYVPFPADGSFRARLYQMDAKAMEAAGSLDSALFLDTLRDLHSTVCGYGPISLLLATLGFLGGDDVFQQTLDYQASADITGDTSHSVSYGSLGYFRTDSYYLDAEAQASLLTSARATLRQLCATGERQAVPPVEAGGAMARRLAAFVSLHQGEELFGCIGMRSTELPLAELVPELTLSAALDDPRFPVRDSVPEGLDLEISVLTPMKRIRDWTSFRVGRDGACLDYDGRTQLLLPQVAREGGYTATRFLEALSRKGGLGPNAYRDQKARLFVFQAQVFGCRADRDDAGFRLAENAPLKE